MKYWTEDKIINALELAAMAESIELPQDQYIELLELALHRTDTAPHEKVDWKDAYEAKIQDFQQETRRTSELSVMVRKMIERFDHAGCKPGVWSRGCATCELVKEAEELLEKPINAQDQDNG